MPLPNGHLIQSYKLSKLVLSSIKNYQTLPKLKMVAQNNESGNHKAQITANNPKLSEIKLSWATVEYSAFDGIAPMGSLHEAGDSLVAVATMIDGELISLGSGVMVGPGLILTATHVLDEISSGGSHPLFMSFLPNSSGRVWLPKSATSTTRPSIFDETRKVSSDLTIVSCTLNSEAHEELPLMLTPIQIALPLIGERLWAFGYRHERTESDIESVTPYVSSGLVTACFPSGRGERMPAPCFEVDMETFGGMSGGPVVNSEGYIVGVVSTSFDGGPSYITLIWDAMRLPFQSPFPESIGSEINLFDAQHHKKVKIKGKVTRKLWGDVVFTMSEEEMNLLIESMPAGVEKTANTLSDTQIEEFLDTWGNDLESHASHFAIEHLESLPQRSMTQFLIASEVNSDLLNEIQSFSVEDFEGVEDPEILSMKTLEGSLLEIDYFFNLRSVAWTIKINKSCYESQTIAFKEHFAIGLESDDTVNLCHVQRCYFRINLNFDNNLTEFIDSSITWTGVLKPRKKSIYQKPISS